MVRISLYALLVGVVPAAAELQRPLSTVQDEPPKSVTAALFSSLERMSRMVDIAYCVGSTGVSEPFACASRCKEFPTLTLATTWNTGMLLSDSCGYIAVDNAARRPDADDEYGNDLGEKSIIVAFRGTYSIANTVVDLSTVPQEYVPYPSPDDGGKTKPDEPHRRCDNCTVHGGFLESWQQARKLVIPELKSLRGKHPDYPIWLVGHSLGGAVAMLAALELKVSLGWPDVMVTTFGEPKVGNTELSRYVDAVFGLDTEDDWSNPEKRTYRRVTHANDPVPLLPLTEWGYRSHGGEFFIQKESLSPSLGDVVACQGDEDRRCIAQGDVELDEGSPEEDAAEALLRHSADSLIVDPEPADQPDASDDEPRWLMKRYKGIPARFKLWQLFFAHRDYFWRIGLCVPGGDPANWGREKYGHGSPDDASPDEL